MRAAPKPCPPSSLHPGADVVGADDLIASIAAGGGASISFDRALATPSLMPRVAKAARVTTARQAANAARRAAAAGIGGGGFASPVAAPLAAFPLPATPGGVAPAAAEVVITASAPAAPMSPLSPLPPPSASRTMLLSPASHPATPARVGGGGGNGGGNGGGRTTNSGGGEAAEVVVGSKHNLLLSSSAASSDAAVEAEESARRKRRKGAAPARALV